MSRPSTGSRNVLILCGIASAVLAASPVWAGTPITYFGQPANASIAPDNYHNQITTFYCGAAAIEMQLDSTAWRGFLSPPYTAANIQNQNIQNTIYGVSHGNSGPGWASDPNGLTTALNAATGNAGFFVQNDDATLNTANRNIANALELTGAPVSALINHSAHWIDVYGAVTNVAPAVNAAYTINGFLIRDPWFAPGGLGPNTYLANNARAWGRYFNAANPQAGAPWSGKYTTVVDPIGPELPDNGSNDSFPAPFPTVPTITSATVAAADAGTDTTADTEFNGDEEPGGSFNSTDSQLMHFSDDTGAEGDWVVPYEDASGVGGFELIDDTTGEIDQATWFTAGTEIPLSDMLQDVTDEFSGNLISDATPEPASLGTLLLGGALLLKRRTRRPVR